MEWTAADELVISNRMQCSNLDRMETDKDSPKKTLLPKQDGGKKKVNTSNCCCLFNIQTSAEWKKEKNPHPKKHTTTLTIVQLNIFY